MGIINSASGPGRRLVWWYKQLGREDDARKLLLRFAKPDESNNPGYGGGYWQYWIMNDGIAVAQEFLMGGDPVEAVRIYNRLLADTDTLNQANQWGGQQFDKRLEQGLKAAVKAVKPATLPAAVGRLLTPRTPTATDKSVLDLVILIESRGTAKATLDSMLARALKSMNKAPDAPRRPGQALRIGAKASDRFFGADGGGTGGVCRRQTGSCPRSS